MSRIALPADHGAEVGPTPRGRLTPKERQAILDRQGDRCACCGASLLLDAPTRLLAPMIDEHLIPLGLGGSNDLRNRALYCIGCAKAKTAQDLADIAKAKRRAFKAAGGKKPGAGRLKGRGFQKWSPPDLPEVEG